MKSTFIAILFAACLGLGGCNEKVDKFHVSENFVTRYQNPTTAYAEARETLKGLPITENQTVNHFVVILRVDENTLQSQTKDLVDESTFRELSAKFNDTEYNKADSYLTCPMMYVQSESLHIVSDQDYNATHPAGSSLNDLFTVEYTCADDILKNGYDLTQSAVQQELGLPAWRFKEPVEDFNRKKPTLVWFEFLFRPTLLPDRTGSHRFTITYHNTEGKELTATTLPVMLAGASD